MLTLLEPSFIDRDVDAITAECVALYESMTGKVLYPAQPERLFIDLMVAREMQLRIRIQQSAVKNLVRFSSGIMLEELGALVGCSRLPAQYARTTLRVTLSGTLDYDLVVSAGTRRQSKDGKITFATAVPLTIAAGALTGDVLAIADLSGVSGNGYLAGEVNIEVDPLPHVATVANISTTAGGSDIESDDHYRDRIMIAPESFSTTGPEDAYIYWAKTAHPDIVAVAVSSPAAGEVTVYPLMGTGNPSAEILDLVEAALTPKKRRPLTDLVTAAAPTKTDFTITADVTLYESCTEDSAAVKANIEALLLVYADELRASLGADLVTSRINSKIMGYPGVYKSVLTLPVADAVIPANGWLNCTAITITVVGYVNG